VVIVRLAKTGRFPRSRYGMHDSYCADTIDDVWLIYARTSCFAEAFVSKVTWNVYDMIRDPEVYEYHGGIMQARSVHVRPHGRKKRELNRYR
jgi:hypothetical protein